MFANTVAHTPPRQCYDSSRPALDNGGTMEPWWKVDLAFLATVKKVKVWNRTDYAAGAVDVRYSFSLFST